ncbi:serine/threonine-protein phosphatase 6 regulatory subunit 3-like [Orbicella faveolata]|uniref:serine/threonine-protein phosphatase 6 regulatory subunit 3-like n=1 Tax=Orbicella faveolata TaxID=48498 RepID=UPI0009E1EA4C|nr:serine/threonine-protein phosphatase 6 regulatory subunit 3-like [Orbicella faveolata]
MFWKFDLHPSSAIDTMLTREDCTLSEILDEDDVLQETKSQNRKLVDFFIRPEILEELVNLVLQPPDESKEECLKYKHPNMACEVLTADVYAIIDKLTNNEDLLNKIWSFMESEPPLNPLLASFFSKVMGVLISRKTSLMLEYLKSKEDFVNAIVKHLGTSAVMDLLLRLITSVESPQLRQDLLEWLNGQKLVESLVSLIDPEIDEERSCNAAQSLCDVIRLSRDHMSQLQENADQDPLLDAVQRRETVSELLDHMLHDAQLHPDVALVNGISVLLTLLEVRKGSGEGEEPMTPLDAERLAQGVSATLAALTPRLKDFHQLLVDPPPMKPMLTTIGTLDPPLGNARLQASKLIAAILATNSDTINAELANLGTLQVLWELFFKYSWNNFLHTQVEKCITTVLNNPPTEEDGEQSTPLVDVLFKDCQIIQRILQEWDDLDSETGLTSKRKGYMGHLTNVANSIVQSVEKGKNKAALDATFSDLPENVRERWNAFVSGKLADVNKQNLSELVGHHFQSSSDDEDDFKPISFLHTESSLQQAFSRYQVQQITTEFMDTFGLDEDEFQEPDDSISGPFDRIGDLSFRMNAHEDNPNTALFEACCNEKIQQFDDSGSDEEDIWEEKELTFSSIAESRQSTLSPEGESDSESSESDDDLESPGGKAPNVPYKNGSSPQGSPVKQPPPAADNKMEVDPTDAWSLAFEPEEVAVDEAVSMDASDVGWGETPAATTDTGWATFDSFTDIRMAPSSQPSEDAGDPPVAMETEPSPPASQAGAAYIVKDKSNPDKQDESRTQGLVSSAEALGVATETEGKSTDKAKHSPVVDRAALYRCEGRASDSSAPLATDDSDDDISDDETPSVRCEEAFSRLTDIGVTEGESADSGVMPLNNVHKDTMSSTKMDNGPVDFTKEPGNQGLTKKTKLDQDTRSPLKELVESQTSLVNGPG